MTYYLTYQIKCIDGQFIMQINQQDDIKYVSTRIKREFGIIQNLSAKIYGLDLQSSSIISQCVRCQDIVTFDVKQTDDEKPKFEMYQQPIITPRYQSKTTFIVFTTFNFKSMITGDKIKVNIENDTIDILRKKIREMVSRNYKVNDKKAKLMNIQLFLPGGIPLLNGTINDFIKSLPYYMPHLYAIIVYDKKINEKILDEKFETECNNKNEKIRSLISPDVDCEKKHSDLESIQT